jgi:hypothetical protein
MKLKEGIKNFVEWYKEYYKINYKFLNLKSIRDICYIRVCILFTINQIIVF